MKKNLCVHGLKRLNIFKMIVLSRMVYRFRQSLSKPQWSIKHFFFTYLFCVCFFYISVLCQFFLYICFICLFWSLWNGGIFHCGAWTLVVSRMWTSVVLALKLNYLVACRILVPWPGIKPASPALQGRYLPTGPSGKPPSGVFFAEIEKLILRFVWHFKGPEIALLKRNKLGGLILPDIETYSRATVIKTVWYCHKYSSYRTE